MDNGNGGDLVAITSDESINLETVKLFTGLQKGKMYSFAYRVQNVNGWSVLSDPVMIRAAITPAKP